MRVRKIRTQLQRVLCQLPHAFIAFRRVQRANDRLHQAIAASTAHAMP